MTLSSSRETATGRRTPSGVIVTATPCSVQPFDVDRVEADTPPGDHSEPVPRTVGQARSRDARSEHEETVVLAHLIRPQLGAVLRKELMLDACLVEKTEPDVDVPEAELTAQPPANHVARH